MKKYSIFDIGKSPFYFDENSNTRIDNKKIMNKVAQKCYLPTNAVLLELIKKYPKFKISFSISGTALDQFEKYAPEVLQSFKDLVATGNVEILEETYYHSLSFLYSKQEFREQVNLHSQKIQQLFGKKPQVFRNTELIYNDSIAKEVEDMGYKGIIAEGADHVLGWRSPNFVYAPEGTQKIKLLLKNYKLSDDIAFRFSNRGWQEWPLTAEKYAQWVSAVNGGGQVINLFMDYETFGEHQWADTGIFDFLRALPGEILKHPHNDFKTPSEVIKKYSSIAQISVPYFVSWADLERDLTAWNGNDMQKSALHEIYAIENQVVKTNNPSLLNIWRRLQTSDHFYYMCTKWFADGDVHKYFNPYESPYEAFINYMNILADLKLRLKEGKTNIYKQENIFYNDIVEKQGENMKEVTSVELPEQQFWFQSGTSAKNLKELQLEIQSMNDELFSFHVNEQKNDFANWIKDVLKDEVLANRLYTLKNKDAVAQTIQNHISTPKKKTQKQKKEKVEKAEAHLPKLIPTQKAEKQILLSQLKSEFKHV